MAIATSTALAISAIATVAGAAVSAVGAVRQGQAAKHQASYSAAVQEQQAAHERNVAAAKERDFRREQSTLQARRRAVLGTTGVETSTGSPLLQAEDFAAEIELQARRIRAGGEVSATRLEQQAELERAAGKSAAVAGYISAGGSLLRGIGRSAYLLRPVPAKPIT